MRAMLVGLALGVLAGPAHATEYVFGNDLGWGGVLQGLPSDSSYTMLEYGLNDLSLDPFGEVYYVGFRSWLCYGNSCDSWGYASYNYEDYIQIFMSSSGLFDHISIDGRWDYVDVFTHYLGEATFSGALTSVPSSSPPVAGAPGPVVGAGLPGVVVTLLAGWLLLRRRG